MSDTSAHVDPTGPLPMISAPVTADDYLRAAEQAVRHHCGWHVTPVITETLTLNGSGSRTQLLPSGRVLAVTVVTDDGDDITSRARWGSEGILELDSGCFTSKLRGVTVRLEHGFTPEEAADVLGIIRALAARSGTPAGIVSEAIGPANVRYDVAPLLEREKLLLQPFVIRGGA